LFVFFCGIFVKFKRKMVGVTMKILKFGGTSISDATGIIRCTRIIQSQKAQIIVCSAFSGITDALINAGLSAASGISDFRQLSQAIVKRHEKAVNDLLITQNTLLLDQINEIHREMEQLLEGVYLLREFSPRTRDLIVSFGEKITARLLVLFLNSQHIPAEFCDSYHLIYTNEVFGQAKIDTERSSKAIKEHFSKIDQSVTIIPGFTGRTENGVITTLGRGGSDLTATYIGAVLEADEIQIWTDVNGFMSADPNKVKEAFSLSMISYDEALELSYFGAKVLLPHSIRPAKEKGVPIVIKNTFDPSFAGTICSAKTTPLKHFAKGITSIDRISLINIKGSGMIGVRGISARIFRTLADQDINVILISQASSEQSVCVAVEPKATLKACKSLKETFQLEMMSKMIDEIGVEENLSIIAVVGDRMKNTPGVAGRIFNAFGENGVNVIAIAQGASELNISIVISKEDEERALNSLHNAFFTQKRILNLIIAGKGLIGSELIEQIKYSRESFQKSNGVELRVISVLDSKNMIFHPHGIDLSNWKKPLGQSHTPSDIRRLLTFIEENNLINTVFIDCTASEQIADHYLTLMKNRISIVAANKIANTKPMSDYKRLKKTAAEYKVHFLYETNAGAGLPIIDTIRNLRDSGDEIIKFEAILSGTISFIFNSMNENAPFSETVKRAKDLGYTEPDPRVDLSGTDFARKILLLVRESGVSMEIEDIAIERLIPTRCFQAEKQEDLYLFLKEQDNRYAQWIKKASQKNAIIRCIGKYEGGKASISLLEINQDHPFYSLQGTDNIIAIYTRRYTNPLVIKGAGAGAEVTAGGVMSDIFRIATAMNKRWDY